MTEGDGEQSGSVYTTNVYRQANLRSFNVDAYLRDDMVRLGNNNKSLLGWIKLSLARQYAENPDKEADAQQIGSLAIEHLTRTRREACRFSPRLTSRLRTKDALPNTKYEGCAYLNYSYVALNELQADVSDRYSHDACLDMQRR